MCTESRSLCSVSTFILSFVPLLWPCCNTNLQPFCFPLCHGDDLSATASSHSFRATEWNPARCYTALVFLSFRYDSWLDLRCLGSCTAPWYSLRCPSLTGTFLFIYLFVCSWHRSWEEGSAECELLRIYVFIGFDTAGIFTSHCCHCVDHILPLLRFRQESYRRSSLRLHALHSCFIYKTHDSLSGGARCWCKWECVPWYLT